METKKLGPCVLFEACSGTLCTDLLLRSAVQRFLHCHHNGLTTAQTHTCSRLPHRHSDARPCRSIRAAHALHISMDGCLSAPRLGALHVVPLSAQVQATSAQTKSAKTCLLQQRVCIQICWAENVHTYVCTCAYGGNGEPLHRDTSDTSHTSQR